MQTDSYEMFCGSESSPKIWQTNEALIMTPNSMRKPISELSLESTYEVVILGSGGQAK